MSPKPKPKPKPESSTGVRRNIYCRFCGLTSGYLQGEEKCHYCKQKVFAVDAI